MEERERERGGGSERENHGNCTYIENFQITGFLWSFFIFYRLLEANGTRFMNVWSYGVSMVFLWCIL